MFNKKNSRSAFTMIELIFVIVVLGILASVAIPRLAATRTDAQIAKGRANVLAIRSGIITDRQSRMFRGDSRYATQLDAASANTAGVNLFDNNGINGNGILATPVISSSADGHWIKATTTGGQTASYLFTVENISATFDYNATQGSFICDRDAGNTQVQGLCRNLTE